MSVGPHASQYSAYALALLRIVSGVLFLEHAMVKLFGFPPGAAPGVQALFSLFGVAGVLELVTGVLIVLGLFTRQAAFLASGEMAVGYWLVHAPQSVYPALNGGDAAILFCFIFLYLAAAGAGAFSVDGRLPTSASQTVST